MALPVWPTVESDRVVSPVIAKSSTRRQIASLGAVASSGYVTVPCVRFRVVANCRSVGMTTTDERNTAESGPDREPAPPERTRVPAHELLQSAELALNRARGKVCQL